MAVAMFKYGSIQIFGSNGNLITLPNYPSWIDLAVDESKTISEKMEMLLTMAEYAKSLPSYWPTWQDGSPVLPGQMALSLWGPMPVDEVVVYEDGSYSLLSVVGYEINGGEAGQHPERALEYVEYFPSWDEEPIAHIMYYESAGVIGPQRKDGRFFYEPTDDGSLPELPEFIDHRKPKKKFIRGVRTREN